MLKGQDEEDAIDKDTPIEDAGEAGLEGDKTVEVEDEAPTSAEDGTPVDAGAHQASTSPLNDKTPPTEEQRKSGDYEKGHIKVGLLDIAIENPCGSKRREEWPALSDHYGYVKSTTGFDKDAVDVFVRPGTEDDYSGPVHVIDQLKADGSFDEHKAMVGWSDQSLALHSYLDNYSPGWDKRVGGVVTMTQGEFLAWAKQKGSAGPLGRPAATASVPDDAVTACSDVVTGSWSIADSKADGVLGTLVQTMTRADHRTKNGYVYDRSVLNRAIADASNRVRVGAMLSERHHPQLVPNASDKNGTKPKYVNNYDHTTARVVSISDVGPDGWVTVTREILDTPDGNQIWKAAQSGKPWALSVRWMTDGAAPRTGRPTWMELVTVDDVESPAVEGAGTMLALLDDFGEDRQKENAEEHGEDRRPEGPQGLGEPFQGENRNTVNPQPDQNTDPEVEKVARGDSSPETGKTMSEALKQARALTTLVASKKATKADLGSAMKVACAAIRDEYAEGGDVSNANQLVKAAYKAIQDADTSAAYHPGVEGPYIELGNQMMMDPKSGWGPDLRDVPESDNSSEDRNVQQNTDKSVHGLAITADEEAKAKKEAIEAAVDELVLGDRDWSALSDSDKALVIRLVTRKATDVEGVKDAYDAVVAPLKAQADSARRSQEKLEKMGFGTGEVSKTATVDPTNPMAGRVNESRPGAAALAKLLTISDDMHRAGPLSANMGVINPDDPDTKTLRAYNMAKMNPLIDQWEESLAGRIGSDKFYGALADSSDADDQIKASVDAVFALGDSYTSAIAQVPNQPLIWRWLLTQAFQDMRALAFVSAIGQGQASESGQGWEAQTGLGRVFKVPYETYVDPTGTGFEFGGLDFSLLQTENAGINEGTVQLYWDTFAPVWRGLAASMTVQGIKSIGNGPLNYALGMRNIWHMLARKSRAIDKACFDEMARVALEYGAVSVSAETYTAGNSGLANQTVYQNSSATVPGVTATSVVVNLNPAKTAVAAVVLATDNYVAYPVPNITPGAGGQVPIAAVRLLGGQAVGASAAPYFGTNGVTQNPIVPPRPQVTLTSAGADSTSTLNPITVTAPGSAVKGYLGSDGYIYSLPGTTATYAVDYINGVVLFASGVAQNATVIGTTITLSYSYTTNFDYFALVPGLNGLAGLSTGETIAQYQNKFLAQFDFSAGVMASWPRFVAPDLAIMSSTVSPFITEATAFYKLNSPRNTVLYPTEEYFAERNGIDMARINTPWFVGDTGLLLTRRNTTKYAIDTPAEVKGPFVKYDASGNVIAGEGYYLMENSAIVTPQVKNSAGTIINPVGRFLLLLQGGKASCGLPY